VKKNQLGKFKEIALQAAGLAVLVIFYFTLPSSTSFSNTATPYIRYALYVIALHFLVAFAPFTKYNPLTPFIKGEGEINGFWQYNKGLFIRILTAILFSGVLYLGLSFALLAIDYLLGIEIREQFYGELGVIIVGIFNTWFFLAGIPEKISKLDKVQDYPKGLRIFSQYILIPLIVIYLMILYSYTIKIMITWDWPEGTVSLLILALSIIGMLALLLLHPYSYRTENAWIRKFSKSFYIALLPLIIVLFLAIWIRVSDYGITVSRYFLILLAIWLACIVIYFIFSKGKNIKSIPISLFLITILSSFGPWGAFSISERSQVNRLTDMMTDNGLLKDNKILKKHSRISSDVHSEIQSILNYLDEYHGFESINPWFEQDLDSLFETEIDTTVRYKRYSVDEVEIIMELMGLEKALKEFELDSYSFAWAKENDIIDVGGFDYLIELILYSYNKDKSYNFEIDSNSYEIKIHPLDPKITIMSAKGQLIMQLNLEDICNELLNEHKVEYYNRDVPAKNMTIQKANKDISISIQINSMTISKEDGKLKLEELSAEMLFNLYE